MRDASATVLPGKSRISPEGREGVIASLSESEHSVRHLKSSLSVVAAFHAEGFPSPPAGLAAIVADFVQSATRGIPLSQFANMTPGTGVLANAASAAVNQVIGGMTHDQKEVMKAGGNPFDAAAVARFADMLGKFGTHAAAMAMANGGGETGERVASLGSSGATRYGAVKDTGTTVAPEVVAAYARDQGVSWVGGHPDVLRLGPSAVKAFADVGLKEETYRGLREHVQFTPKDVVDFSKFAKLQGLTPEQTKDLGKAMEEIAKKLNPEERKAYGEAWKSYMNAKPEDREEKKRKLDELRKGLRAKNPELEQHFKREDEIIEKKAKEQGAAATAGAEQSKAATARTAAAASDDVTDALLNGADAPKPDSAKQGEVGAKPDAAKPAEVQGGQPARPADDKKGKAAPSPAPGK